MKIQKQVEDFPHTSKINKRGYLSEWRYQAHHPRSWFVSFGPWELQLFENSASRDGRVHKYTITDLESGSVVEYEAVHGDTIEECKSKAEQKLIRFSGV